LAKHSVVIWSGSERPTEAKERIATRNELSSGYRKERASKRAREREQQTGRPFCPTLWLLLLLEFISPTRPGRTRRVAPCKDAAVSFFYFSLALSHLSRGQTAVKYIQNKTTSSN
jgi:hypothetical protein